MNPPEIDPSLFDQIDPNAIPMLRLIRNAVHPLEVVNHRAHNSRVVEATTKYCFSRCCRAFKMEDSPIEPGERTCLSRCTTKFLKYATKVPLDQQ